MNKTSTFQQKFPWRLMTFLAIGVAVAAIAPYATFNPDNFNNATARYATESVFRQAGLYVHIFASGIALVLGPFQFLSGLRARRPSIHRWMGRIYLTGSCWAGYPLLSSPPALSQAWSVKSDCSPLPACGCGQGGWHTEISALAIYRSTATG